MLNRSFPVQSLKDRRLAITELLKPAFGVEFYMRLPGIFYKDGSLTWNDNGIVMDPEKDALYNFDRNLLTKD